MFLLKNNQGISTMLALGILSPIAWVMGQPCDDCSVEEEVTAAQAVEPAIDHYIVGHGPRSENEPKPRIVYIPIELKDNQAIMAQLNDGDRIVFTKTVKKTVLASPEKPIIKDAVKEEIATPKHSPEPKPIKDRKPQWEMDLEKLRSDLEAAIKRQQEKDNKSK